MRNRNEWFMMARTYTPHISGFYLKNILSPKSRKIWQGLCPYFWYFLKNAWSPFVSPIWPGLRRHIFYKKLKSQSVWPFDRTLPYDATAVVRNSAIVTSNSSALCFSLWCRRHGPWLGGRDLKCKCRVVDSITPRSTLPFHRAHRLRRLIGLPGSQH